MWQLLGRYPFIMHTDRDIISRYSKRVSKEHGVIPEIAVVSRDRKKRKQDTKERKICSLVSY